VVRITSDCPLIGPSVSARVIKAYRDADGGWDDLSINQQRTFPRGLETEVFSRSVLERANAEAIERPDREHVTPYIWRQPQLFKVGQYKDVVDRQAMRWTVDTPDDYRLVSLIYDALWATKPEFDFEDILEILAQNPGWSDINRHIRQKNYDE
jgi:spore coat polysaccharide biosynthesis protein SpsF